MPKLSQSRLPVYSHHRASGQAVVALNGQDVYLGVYNSPESREKYNRVIGEWLANGRKRPVDPGDITVIEVIDRFMEHALAYYRRPDGTHTSEIVNFGSVLHQLRLVYGRTSAADFGPLSLEGLRDRLIRPHEVEDPKSKGRSIVAGWSRSHTNKQIGRVKMMFKWAVAKQLIPPSVYHGLLAIAGLRTGRTQARETDPVKPVADEHIDAVLPFVSKQIAAMIELQRLTGARGGELFPMRRCDMDMAGAVWIYRPVQHKTLHHGHTREIRLGRRAQQVIAPFFKPDLSAYLFSPIDAEAQRRSELTAKRLESGTPLSCGNRVGSNRRARPEREPGPIYTRDSYARAIARACDKADLWAHGGKVIANDERIIPRWHPHQIRHTAATRLRREYGLEAAQVILGQKTLTVTQVYAEKNVALADQIMAEVG